MITPVNGHLLIEPLVHESFVSSQKEAYEEIGIVLEVARNLQWYENGELKDTPVSKGEKVFFDSWLAAKFPGEKEGEYLWLVKWEDVRAVEHA